MFFIGLGAQLLSELSHHFDVQFWIEYLLEIPNEIILNRRQSKLVSIKVRGRKSGTHVISDT